MQRNVQASERNKTAASADTLHVSAVAVPRNEEAAFYELVVEIKIGGTGHTPTPREAEQPSTTNHDQE